MNGAVTTSESPLPPTGARSADLPAPAARPPRIWKFWATLAWSLLIYAVMTASAVVGIMLVVRRYDVDFGDSAVDRAAFLNNGLVVAATSMSATVPVLLVLALAIRLARQNLADYLALRRPSMRHACIGLGAIVVLMVVIDGLSVLLGRPVVPDVLLEEVRSVREHNALAFFALALVVTAPITEEAVFRGFIYRGFAASRLGVIGAVIVSSVIFAAIHIQYDPITLCGVLATALLLGIMRAVSGSTLLTMAMHALNNAVVLLEMLWFAGLLPHA